MGVDQPPLEIITFDVHRLSLLPFMKDFFIKMGRCFGSSMLRAAEIIFPLIPLPVLSLIFDLFFFLSYPVLLVEPNFRTVVLPNINTAFGGTLSACRKRRIGVRTMRRLFRMIPFCIHYAHPRNRHKILRDVRFEGLEHLRGALERGRGVIMLQAHFGNFILMTIAFARLDLPYVVVTKDPKNTVLRDRYNKWKREMSVRWIDADTRSRATREIMRGLTANNIVALVADERKKYDGIPVPFFGKEALTTPGPAVLALRTGAPIVPSFIIDHRPNRYTVQILPPLPVTKTGDYKADIYRLTEQINHVIEDYIRRYPDLWAWTNKRWK
jgi:KDO2-lipid IV(A) lauroyltransferase